MTEVAHATYRPFAEIEGSRYQSDVRNSGTRRRPRTRDQPLPWLLLWPTSTVPPLARTFCRPIRTVRCPTWRTPCAVQGSEVGGPSGSACTAVADGERDGGRDADTELSCVPQADRRSAATSAAAT
jgi:hypothetical protein